MHGRRHAGRLPVIGPTTVLPGRRLPAVWGGTETPPGLRIRPLRPGPRPAGRHRRIRSAHPPAAARGSDHPRPRRVAHGLHSRRQARSGRRAPTGHGGPGEERGLPAPLLLHRTEKGWAELENDPTLANKRRELADTIGPCVTGSRDCWLPHREAPRSPDGRRPVWSPPDHPVRRSTTRPSSTATPGYGKCPPPSSTRSST
jgi:hypothetical protein